MKKDHPHPADPAIEERRRQIKEAARKVFAERGLAGAKMSMVSEEAGISQGLTYRYFRSKEDLFTELVEEALEEARQAVMSAGSTPGTPQDQLRQFTLRMLDAEHKHSFLLVQQAQTADAVPDGVRELLLQYSARETIAPLIPIVESGQRLGQFRSGDPRRMLFLYLSVLTGLMLQDLQNPDNRWVEEVDVLMNLLR